MSDFFGVVEVVDYGGYGSSSYPARPADTKEEALILLGQKMLQFPSYCIVSATVYDKNHEKVYSYEQKDAHFSYEYAKNHYDEHIRMKKATESRWIDLDKTHRNIDDYMYGGEKLTV